MYDSGPQRTSATGPIIRYPSTSMNAAYGRPHRQQPPILVGEPQRKPHFLGELGFAIEQMENSVVGEWLLRASCALLVPIRCEPVCSARWPTSSEVGSLRAGRVPVFPSRSTSHVSSFLCPLGAGFLRRHAFLSPARRQSLQRLASIRLRVLRNICGRRVNPLATVSVRSLHRGIPQICCRQHGLGWSRFLAVVSPPS